MKISLKPAMLVVLVSAVIAFMPVLNRAEAAAKPSKDAKMTVKDTNVPASETKSTPQTKVESPSMTPQPPAKKPATAEPMPSKSEPNLTKSSPVDSLAEGNEVAVTVNGVVITESQLNARIMPRLARLGSQLSPAVVEQYKNRMRNQMLEGMILERLLDERVAKAGITVSKDDVNDKINEIINRQGMSIKDFKSMLEAQGQDFNQVMHEIEKTVGYEKLIDSQLPSKDINDADISTAYELNKEQYHNPEQVQASHILVKPDQNNPDVNQARAQAKAKAEKLLKQLQDGADFATLARENSDCPSKARGGDLGFFTKGQMVQPFEDVAFALKPGQLSDIVETQFGYHIIKVAQHKPEEVIPLEKVKGDIAKMILDRKRSEFFRTYRETLKAEATIVYPPGKEPAAISTPGMNPQGENRSVPKSPASPKPVAPSAPN